MLWLPVLPAFAERLLRTLDDPNPQAQAQFGHYGISSLGDLDGDLIPDMIVGAWLEDVGANSDQGQAFVLSGADGSLIRIVDHPSPQAGARFGQWAAGIGDVDGDLIPDIAVAALSQDVGGIQSVGQVYVISGDDGSVIHTLDSPNPQPFESFGLVSAVGDVDGDVVPDIVVGAVGGQGSGHVFLFSGASGGLIRTISNPTPQAGDLFGVVDGIGDVDGDTVPDLAVGAGLQDVGGISGAGQAFLFSGADGSLIHTLDHPEPQFLSQMGRRVAGLGDVNGDLVPDVVAGAIWQDVGGNVNQGQAYVFSGADGSVIRILDHPEPQPQARFGALVAASADADGDGVSDIAISATDQDVAGNPNQGQAYVFSAVDGSHLFTLDDPNPQAFAGFGNNVVSVGDVSGDGEPELAIGSPGQDVGGNGLQGRVYLFSLTRDLEGDGIADEVDGEFVSGVFVDESTAFSDNFTDQHLGGTTFGFIVSRGPLSVTVADEPDPEGVRVAASGVSGKARIRACGNSKPVALTSGDVILVSCSALTVEVVVGPVEVELSLDALVTVPAGAIVTIAELGDEQVAIENNSPVGTPPVGITIGSQTISLEPGTSLTVCSTLPTLAPPGPIAVECSESGGNPASDPQIQGWLTSAAAASVCGAVTLSDDAPGFFFVGTTQVTFTAVDEFGNTVEGTSTVTVEDTTPPSIDSVDFTPDTLWPPNHRMIDAGASIFASDVCSTPTVLLGSIASNEPDDGTGDGDTINDIQHADHGTPDFEFRLRAERAGSGNGRIYTAIYSATDDSGNSASVAGFFLVPHSQGGVVEPLDILVEEDSGGTLVRWSPVSGALSYDVIRGQLGNIGEAGQVIDLGPVVCIEEDSLDEDTSGSEDSAIPNPGEAFFYLVEYDDGVSSSYGTVSASLPRAAGPGDCP